MKKCRRVEIKKYRNIQKKVKCKIRYNVKLQRTTKQSFSDLEKDAILKINRVFSVFQLTLYSPWMLIPI